MTPLQSTWAQALQGQSIDRYVLRAPLGGGQFGLVFEAEDPATGQAVAVKVLLPTGDPDAALEFKREGILLARMAGASNVVALHETRDFTWAARLPSGAALPLSIQFHVMELAHACLEELLTRRDELSWRERLLLWRGTILGVHQMHLRNVVHRDLKSSNCLLFVRPKKRTDCKVSDLGRSRHVGSPAQHPDDSYLCGRGDLRFAPPEFLWWQGDDTPESHRKADLYGLGSLLFEMATGQGITGLALGFGPMIVQQSMGLAFNGHKVDLSGLQGKYEKVLALFEASMPPSIAPAATTLLRQLCDPVPDKRLPTSRTTGRQIPGGGVDWLLRKADILTKGLAREPKSTSATKLIRSA